jgi:MFS family permease
MADRRGGRMLLRGGAGLGLASLLCYAVAPSFLLLALACVCGGLASAANDIGLQSVMIENTPNEERAAVMAGWNALTGARGIAAPFMATILVQVGLVNVTGALVLCAAATGVGAWMFYRIANEGRVREEGTPALRRLAARWT